tara:strand:- start:499 stop:1374 length:876 start_codon:yes stop_codon:yes gene_type:complete
MTYFIGHYGKIKLKRNSQEVFTSSVSTDDVNTTLNRFSFNGSLENLLTGDQLVITTNDPRGLDFMPSSSWPNGGGATLNNIVLYSNINAVGGIRLFNTFPDAINNVRAREYPLEAFTGAPIEINVRILGSIERVLGDVNGFSFSTDRESIETTSLNDKFKRMHSAGLISGGGSIDCLFGASVDSQTENSLLMLQLINRMELGSEFSCFLQLVDSSVAIYSTAQDIYYEFNGIITKSGVDVRSDALISCAIDFVTTGEIKLLIGRPSGYLLKEDTDKVQKEDLSVLLTEETD